MRLARRPGLHLRPRLGWLGGKKNWGHRTVTLSFDAFLNVDIRVGTITRAEAFPEARRPAFKLWVDFGEALGVKKTSAQITKHYALEDLAGRQVVAVVNFPPKQIGKFMSEVLVLGVPDSDGEVVLLQPSLQVPLGGRMY